jgi:protein-disulfide isomerase
MDLNGRRLAPVLAWIPILLMFWIFTGCQGTPSGEQATKTAADPLAGTANGPGAARSDSASELCLGGERGAPVKIEVFSDYQCPRCRDFYLETLKPLIAEYTKSNQIQKIYIVYHDFPLEMHQFARRAASFALAAAKLGRERWLRVTDILYTQQAEWSVDGNIEAVLAREMNPTEAVRLANMAADPAIGAAVQEELMLGQSRQIASTPTFFITPPTGPPQRVAGWVTYATLKDYLDRCLK